MDKLSTLIRRNPKDVYSPVAAEKIHVAKLTTWISRSTEERTCAYEVYKMWCEENSLNAIKTRGFSDTLIANQRRYNLESTNNIINSSGRRVRGFVGIEALVQPDLTPNGWRA